MNAALGGRHICKKPDRCRFEHPAAYLVRRDLEAWWLATRGAPPTWSTTNLPRNKLGNNAMRGGERSQASADGGSAADGADECKPCTVPRELQIARLAKYAPDSAHVRAFLASPFLDELLSSENTRPLLAMRKCAKEISEAYGGYEAISKVLVELQTQSGGGDGGSGCCDAASGRGAVILDVCCGRGLTGLLLSYLLPEARIVLFDSNGAMDLRHVAARPNVSFVQIDLFSAEAEGALSRAAAGGGACVAIGTHLCGALSPRLIDLSLRLAAINALVLSPCCLRGSLGAKVTRTARAAATAPTPALHIAETAVRRTRDGGHQGEAYVVLVAVLAALCRDELGLPPRLHALLQPGGDDNPGEYGGEGQCGLCEEQEQLPKALAAVRVLYDEAVLSPKNAFIVARKAVA